MIPKCQKLLLVWLALASCGCAQYSSVVEKPTSTVAETKDQKAFLKSVKKGSDTPLQEIARYLDAADAARLILEKDRYDPEAQSNYSFAVARVVLAIREQKLEPWVTPFQCSQGDRSEPWTVSARDLDPRLGRRWSDFHFLSAQQNIKAGDRKGGRTVIPGLGAPVVVASDDPNFEATAETGGVGVTGKSTKKRYLSLTAVIRFDGRSCELALVDPRENETVQLDGQSYPLAADYRAPLVLGMADLESKSSDSGLFKPDQLEQTARIGQLQPYDPDKIPVLFIHGLGNSVKTWMPLIEFLREDPVIRKRYQFIFFSYPSNLPYPISAAILRQKLDRFDERYPGHKNFLVVGHSMGGMISRLLITNPGLALWDSIFELRPEELPVSKETRAVMEETLVFEPLQDISRVIFVSASHRGSDEATSFLGKIGAKLVGNPISSDQITDEALSFVRPDRGAKKRIAERKHIPNSIDILDPDSPFLKKVNSLPLKKGVPYHSIMGDRGKGGNLSREKPVSSDGIVPYWSSHIDGAESEKIVPWGHWSHNSPEGMAEVRRIMLLHLRGR